MDEIRWIREEIRENIDYEGLVLDHPCDQDIVDGYVELMTEAACFSKEAVCIWRQEFPTIAVRSHFLKLERGHIKYVRDCLSHTTNAIGNIKAYSMAALYQCACSNGAVLCSPGQLQYDQRRPKYKQIFLLDFGRSQKMHILKLFQFRICGTERNLFCCLLPKKYELCWIFWQLNTMVYHVRIYTTSTR